MIDFHNFSVKAVRGILFLFNLFFAFTGLILVCIGLMIKEYFYQYEVFIDDKYFSASALLITSGSIIFVIAFFGCCGAIKENRCMILTYSVFLTAIMLLELASGITAYVLTSETSMLVDQKLKTSMLQYSNNTDITILWDTVQQEFKCCGLNNASDWKVVFHNSSVPVSCCEFQHGSLDTFSCELNSSYIYTSSCKEKLAGEVVEHTLLLGSVAFGIIGVQFLGILFSCFLSKSIKNSSYETV